MRIAAKASLAPREPLQDWHYEHPGLGEFDCLIKVESCGVCHSDLHVMDNDWGNNRYPFVPGHEVIGEVVEVGRNVSHLKTGQRVGVGWLRGACMTCDDCVRGDDNLCSNRQALILTGHGGFASHLVTDARFAFPLPDGLDLRTAPPLLCAGVTVYSALASAGLKPGMHVGVIGVGGLGHLAVQYASRLGARVTAFTTSPDKAAEAARFGAHEGLCTGADEKPPRPSRPLDILLSTVPANLDWGSYLSFLGSDGTLSFVGIPSETLQIPVRALTAKRRRVTGSTVGSRAVMKKTLELAADFGIAPVVEEFSLENVNEAIERVRSNQVRYRAVLRMGSCHGSRP